MTRYLKKIEDAKYSLLTGFLGLFSIITIRNIFESAFEGSQTLGFSPVTIRSFYMVFSHFPLFYISIFLWMLLFFCIITKEEWTKISKVLVLGMTAIIIAPFIDIVVSRGSGYQLAYLKGLEEFAEIHRFFDFTKDVMQASWGQRVEILIVILGGSYYVFVKTKNIFKSFLAAIINFLIIVIHGILPNTVALIPSFLGLKALKYQTIITGGLFKIDSQNYSVIFMTSMIIAGILLLFKYNNAFFKQVINFKGSRMIMLFSFLGLVYGTILVSRQFPYLLLSPLYLLTLLISIFSLHAVGLTKEFGKSSVEFVITAIFILYSAITIGPYFLLFTLLLYVLVNIKKLRIVLWMLAFCCGFSAVFQNSTLMCLVPINCQSIRNYGREIAAWNLFLNGDYDKARGLYLKIYSNNKSDEISKRIGQCYLHLGEIDKGINSLMALNKRDYEFFAALGDAYSKKGEYQHAVGLYSQAADKNIEPAEFLSKMAQLYARLGEETKMEGAITRGIQYGMSKFRYYQIRGDYDINTGQYDQALKMYDKALFYNARATLAYSGKGMVYYALGDMAGAETMFGKALNLDPRSDAIINNLGAISLLKHDYTKAREQFTESVEINPHQVEGYYNLGLIAERQSNMDEALKMYKKALANNPDFSQARQAIERIQSHD